MADALRLAAGKPGIVIDVGANGGCEMTAALNAGRRVIGFECLSTAYFELASTKHIAAHPNATILHVCGGARTSMGTLFLASDSSSMLSENVARGEELRKAQAYAQSKGLKVSEAIPEAIVVARIDDLVKRIDVAVVKVDVQGAEYAVFSGMLNILKFSHPVLMYEDARAFRKAGNVWDLLMPLGYHCARYVDDMICT